MTVCAEFLFPSTRMPSAFCLKLHWAHQWWHLLCRLITQQKDNCRPSGLYWATGYLSLPTITTFTFVPEIHKKWKKCVYCFSDHFMGFQLQKRREQRFFHAGLYIFSCLWPCALLYYNNQPPNLIYYRISNVSSCYKRKKRRNFHYNQFCFWKKKLVVCFRKIKILFCQTRSC